MDETGFEKSFIDKATAGKTGEALEKAKLNAQKQIIAIAEDLAKNKVLAYVDNPQVRTQFAMSIRNFARFYRATEDFYRRVVRTVRYNPEAIARASLIYEGVSHSGFVQTDDNGDQYFFYPGLAPVYSVMSRVTDVFGWKDGFKVPAPLEFSGKLKMITPSLNPDSLFPTFAGPLAAVPISFLGSAIPQIKDLEGYLLGSYGEDQPLISAVFPSHINRFLQTLNRDERNSQYASAARKAATYLEATGHGLKPKIDPQTGLEVPPTQGEIAAFQDKWQSSTMTVMLMRFAFGFFAPASPQITLKSDMAKWVRDNGATNYKQVFNQMLSDNNFDIDKTTEEWIKNYPDQMPYTVSESEKSTVAKIAPVEAAANWIDQNAELMKKYPEGASFLIPQSGDFDFSAYKLIMKSGLRSNKTMTDFLSEVQTAKDKNEYFNKRDEYESNLKTAFSDSYRRMLKDEWDVWSTQFKGVRPMLQIELGKGAAGKIEKLRAYEDLRLMLDNPEYSNVQPNTQAVLKSMVKEYENYVSVRDSNFGTFTKTQEYKELLKANVIAKLKELASTNASAQSAYNVLFSSLVRE
jgi:ASC-1-like (ASCH) protein